MREWLIFFVCLLSGCASWGVPDTADDLPTPRMSSDSILLEIDFVEVPSHLNSLDELWSELDEHQLSVDVRRHRAANGLRFGIAGVQLPSSLRALLDIEPTAADYLKRADSLSDPGSHASYRQLPCRSGREYVVVVAPRGGDQVVVPVRDEESVTTREFSNAEGQFVFIATPLGDGRVRLKLTPQVEYGEKRQRFVPGQASFLVNSSREKHTFLSMATDVVLTPGATLVVGASPSPTGVGAWFFSDADEALDNTARRLMMVRLVQTQYDDLFAPEMLGDRLSTSLD